MQTTICTYCDHEVKITPDGVCLFCGGNLADEPLKERKQETPFLDWYKKRIENPIMESQEWEPIKENIKESRVSKAKREMKELDDLTKVVSESETIKNLVKSLDKPLIPFWFKFGAFLLGLVLSAFYTFPSIQELLLETINLVNNSSQVILVMSIIPIFFILVILKKFERF